jgi:fatty acid desaturase
MDESFESRPLLDRDTLRTLQQRRDAPSLIRLTLHLGAFLLGVVWVIVSSPLPMVAACSAVVLGAMWATLFAPFHECTHLTAFRSRRLNALGAWLTGIPFGMAPAVYRAFHFAHHRYTHDPKRDPEIGGAPDQMAVWPTTVFAWLSLISGVWLLLLKVTVLVKFSFLPIAKWEQLAPWAPPEQRSRLAWETRVVAFLWLALVVAAVLGIPGAGWLLLALVLSHFFQAVWLTTEHRGLPFEGTILTRTRTMQTSAFVRWWLWNMNYHAEHHAWPAVPWYQLPAVHARIAKHLDHESPGYWRLQLNVLRRKNLPDGLPPIQAAKREAVI